MASQLPPTGPLQPAYAVQSNNGTATWALVLGILGWTFLPVIGSVLAIVLGIASLNEIKRTGQTGAGMAKAGVWLGGIQVGVSVVVAIIIFIVVIAAAAASTGGQ
jgi:hypothetical protein